MSTTAPDTWRVRYTDGRVVTVDNRAHADSIRAAWGGVVLAPGEHADVARAWLTAAQTVAAVGTPGPWDFTSARAWFDDGRADGTEHVVFEDRPPRRLSRHVASGLTRNDAVFVAGAREALGPALAAVAAALDAADDLDGAAGEYVRARVRAALAGATVPAVPGPLPPSVVAERTDPTGPLTLTCSEHGRFAEIAPDTSLTPSEWDGRVRAVVRDHARTAHPDLETA